MRGMFCFLGAGLLASAAACRGRPAQEDVGGNLTLRRISPNATTLVDAPVRARYCPRDSVLWLVAVGDRWTAALSMRTGRPWSAHFTVAGRLGGLDSAAIGARPIADSIGTAIIAQRGTIDLEGDSVRGRFRFDTKVDSAMQRYSGTFRAMRTDTTGCGQP